MQRIWTIEPANNKKKEIKQIRKPMKHKFTSTSVISVEEPKEEPEKTKTSALSVEDF